MLTLNTLREELGHENLSLRQAHPHEPESVGVGRTDGRWGSLRSPRNGRTVRSDGGARFARLGTVGRFGRTVGLALLAPERSDGSVRSDGGARFARLNDFFAIFPGGTTDF